MTVPLSRQALNRALLERQMLLRRHQRSVAATVEHLVGLQAQNPTDPYYALWSRLDPFHPDDLAGLLSGREAVRTWPMRSTVHLVTAGDALVLLPLTRDLARRTVQSAFGRRLDGIDRDEVAARARELLEEQPRTRAELVPLLRERWPDHDAQALGYAATGPLALVQLPPSGLWGKAGRTGRAVLATVEDWLGRPLADDPSPDDVVLRYLAAFGPAGNADVRTWSGLTGVREITERLRPRLRTFRDEAGRELFDVPDGPLPDPDTPAPVRFLPEFDNVFLSHEDRTRIVDPGVRVGAITVERTVRKLLIDGFVRAEWTVHRRGGVARLAVQPYRVLTASDEEAVEREGAALLDLVAPGDVHELEIVGEPRPVG